MRMSLVIAVAFALVGFALHDSATAQRLPDIDRFLGNKGGSFRKVPTPSRQNFFDIVPEMRPMQLHGTNRPVRPKPQGNWLPINDKGDYRKLGLSPREFRLGGQQEYQQEFMRAGGVKLGTNFAPNLK